MTSNDISEKCRHHGWESLGLSFKRKKKIIAMKIQGRGSIHVQGLFSLNNARADEANVVNKDSLKCNRRQHVRALAL